MELELKDEDDDVAVAEAPTDYVTPGHSGAYEWVRQSDEAPMFGGPDHRIPPDLEALVARGRPVGWARRAPMWRRCRPFQRSVTFSIDMRDVLTRLERNPAAPPGHPNQFVLLYHVVGSGSVGGGPDKMEATGGDGLPPGVLSTRPWLNARTADVGAGLVVKGYRLKDVANQWRVEMHVAVRIGDEQAISYMEHGGIPGMPLEETYARMEPSRRELLELPTAAEVACARSAVPMTPNMGCLILGANEYTGTRRPRDAPVADLSLDCRELRQAGDPASTAHARGLGPYVTEEDLRAGTTVLPGGQLVVLPPDHATLEFILPQCTAIRTTNPEHLAVDKYAAAGRLGERRVIGYVVDRDIFEQNIAFLRRYVAPSILRVPPQGIILQLHPVGCDWERLQEYVKRDMREHQQRAAGGWSDGYIAPQLAGTLEFDCLAFAPPGAYRTVHPGALAATGATFSSAAAHHDQGQGKRVHADENAMAADDSDD